MNDVVNEILLLAQAIENCLNCSKQRKCHIHVRIMIVYAANLLACNTKYSITPEKTFRCIQCSEVFLEKSRSNNDKQSCFYCK